MASFIAKPAELPRLLDILEQAVWDLGSRISEFRVYGFMICDLGVEGFESQDRFLGRLWAVAMFAWLKMVQSSPPVEPE